MSEKKDTSLRLNRLKMASEAYKQHKEIYVDPVTEEPLEGYQTWEVFRDEFLADWSSNRRVVTEKEADMYFDTIVNSALETLDGSNVSVDVVAVAEQTDDTGTEVAGDEVVGDEPTSTVVVSEPVTGEVVVTMKRRPGRPAGTKNAVKTEQTSDETTVSDTSETTTPKRKSYYVPVSQRKAKTPKVVKAKKAAKVKGTSNSDKARELVERYQERDWSRKDIIAKLQDQLGMGAAYASTLYQKFAK